MRLNKTITSFLSHGTFRVPWRTFALTLFMIALYLMRAHALDGLILDRIALSYGEFWRVLTGHFVHFNFDHLFWDLTAFIIFGMVIELMHPKHLIPSLLLSCAAVSMWVVFGQNEIFAYAGLSGALNGMLVVATYIQWRKTENQIFPYIILATIGKIIYELITNKTVFAQMAVDALPQAHFVGLCAGILYVFVWKASCIFSSKCLTADSVSCIKNET